MFFLPVFSPPFSVLFVWKRLLIQTWFFPYFSACFLLYKNSFIYLVLAVLGLCCCAGFSPVTAHGVLTVVVSLVVEHRLQGVWASVVAAGARGGCGRCARWLRQVLSVVAAGALGGCSSWALEHRLNSCGTWAQSLCGMWDISRSGIKSCTDRWILHHSVTKEAQPLFISISLSFQALF